MKECKNVLGEVIWGILKNQTNVQLPSPSSYLSAWSCNAWFITSKIVVRVSLGLDLCTVSQSVNAVRLQKRFEVSCHVNLMLWSYKRGHFALETLWNNPPGKSRPQSSMWRKMWWMLSVLSLGVLEQVTINPCEYYHCLWWHNWILFRRPNLWVVGSYRWPTEKAPFRDQVSRRGTPWGLLPAALRQCSSTDTHPLSYSQAIPAQTVFDRGFWPFILQLLLVTFCLNKNIETHPLGSMMTVHPSFSRLLSSLVCTHSTPNTVSLPVIQWFICSLREGHLISLLNCC